MKIFKRRYTKRSVNNQEVQIFVPVLDDGNLSAKNPSKFSAKNTKSNKLKTFQ